MVNRVVWFDVLVRDLARAMKFYSEVLNVEIREEHPGVGVIAHGPQDIAGCLFRSETAMPSDSGPLLYFNVNGRLQQATEAVARLGGRVLNPPHPIGPFGQRAVVLDSEGNRIALHTE
ncbi:MAG: VOC family protein [Gammaproteobacteria bacterium]|nr:VOC family protein [Gammaproteobacteria bacterium]